MDFINKFRKYNTLLQVLIILIFILLILILYNIFTKNKFENYSNLTKTYSEYDNTNLFDNFYTNIYDKLHNNTTKNSTIVEIIKTKTNVKDSSLILDIGCGTGEIVNKLSEFNILGIDKSKSMIKLCEQKYPDSKFLYDDALNTFSNIYKYEFSHVLCLNNTIYYIKNKDDFLKKCYNLLSQNGIMILHLIEPEKINRTINACKIKNFNPTKFIGNKNIRSKIDFDDYNYLCNYKMNSDNSKGYMNEIFEFNNKSIRKNVHTLYFDNYKSILNIAKKAGFIVNGQIKIKNEDGEYIFILNKQII